MKKTFKRIGRFYTLLLSAAVLSLGLSAVLFGGSVAALILALCGITASVLNIKGIRFCYPLYIIQVVLYGIISYKNKFYGEAAMNLLIAAPIYLRAVIFWKKKAEGRVITDIYSLSPKGIVFIFLALAAAIPALGYALSLTGASLPYANSASAAVYIAGITLSARRNIEQWILMLVYTLIQMAMWATTFKSGLENLPIVVSNVFFTVINISALVTWIKLKKYLDEKTDVFGKG